MELMGLGAKNFSPLLGDNFSCPLFKVIGILFSRGLFLPL